MNLYAILVIYNKSVMDSISYKFIRDNQKSIKLYVVDNSNIQTNNKENVENDGYNYISMNGNKGLPKAYNSALNKIKEDNPDMNGKVVILDDDTELNNDYFQNIIGYDADILLPFIKDGDTVISPCTDRNGVYVPWDGIKEVQNISAINSGMIIDLSIFRSYRYDENLFLDYVDHKFIADMKTKKIQVMNSVLYQNFSGSDVSDLKGSINRLHIFKKDSRYFYKNNYLKYLLVVGKRKLKLAWMYKNPVFLFQ